MVLKYILCTSAIALHVLLFSSCLKSDNNEWEHPVDPQIYAVSLTSKADTNNIMRGIAFTIDQVKGEIYNKEPLPYLFHVDSAKLSISGSNANFSFTRLDLKLADPDSSYTWNRSDSIPILRLQQIETTAPDGLSVKKYKFQLKVYKENPDSIRWERITDNRFTTPVESQKTVAFDNKFYTYYLSQSKIKAVSALTSEASSPQKWSLVNLTGLPSTLQLSSLTVAEKKLYVLDRASGSVYESSNGYEWKAVQTNSGYPVKAIYGELPFSSPDILLAVDYNGTLTFAKTEDFSKITLLLSTIPAGIPIAGFSTVTIESASSYATKFTLLSGGTTAAGNTPNDKIWVIQEDGNVIRSIEAKTPEDGISDGSSLFFYNEKPYLIALASDGENLLMHSADYGISWTEAKENTVFPTEPAKWIGRKNASVAIDDNYIWIFGGISSSGTQLTDIWRGRLNKFALD